MNNEPYTRMNSSLNSTQKPLAFSLIELSIVLIIIGLLVAGITGGKSLIDSAKTKAFINELNEYKQAVYSFYLVKGRYPGDLNNDGYIGRCDSGTGCVKDTYNASSFPAPYNVSVAGDSYGAFAPFVELYLEKIIDFEPTPGKYGPGYGTPYSKVFPSGYYSFYSYGVTSKTGSEFYTDIKNASPYLNFYNTADNYKQTQRFKDIDTKLDDGLYNRGIIRAYNISSSDGTYDSAIKNKTRATDLYYNVGL